MHKTDRNMSRRDWMKTGGAATALCATGNWPAVASPGASQPFPIGACDWSIGRRGTPTAMTLAKTIGLSGIQVSFGAPGGAFDLRNKETRVAYVDAVRTTGVGFASLAMGVLNGVPYSSSSDAETWVSECIDVMALMKKEAGGLDDEKLAAQVAPSVALLAFFGKGDINGKPDLMKAVIERLKRVSEKAENAGVVLGLETWLNADDHLKIVDAVDSPSVQVYYDVANSNKKGYDIYQEIPRIGRSKICQIHAKENGFLLGQGKVDFPRLKKVLLGIGYKDWLIIESATPKGLSSEEAYKQNRAYLQSVFHAS